MRPRPPRTHMPIAVKREAARLQGGVCPCGCGTPCWADEKQTKALVEWDHHPALRLREINKAGADYIPPQNDPAYIVGRCEASHLVKTSGRGATTAGTDTGAIKKERKRDRPPKPKRQIPSRQMGKGRGFPPKGSVKFPKKKPRAQTRG